MDKPTRCFCKLPMDRLTHWARKKYVEGKSTLDLMTEAAETEERELVSLVALLEVDEQELDRLLNHVTGPDCRLDKCRILVRNWLKEMALHNQNH